MLQPCIGNASHFLQIFKQVASITKEQKYKVPQPPHSPSRKASTPGRLRSNCSGIGGSGLVLGLILRPPRGSLTTCSNQRPPGQGAPSGVVVMEPLFSAGVVLCFIGQTTLGLTNFEKSISLFHLLWNQEGSPNLVGGRSYWSFKLFSAISNKHSFLPPQD